MLKCKSPLEHLVSGRNRLQSLIFLLSSLEFIHFLFGPIGSKSSAKGLSDFLFLLLILFHVLWGILLLSKSRRKLLYAVFQFPQFLFSVSLILFIFSFVYALNANMDYVQRFQATGGNINLAPDSTTERLNSLIRYLPFLLLNGFVLAFLRVVKKNLALRAAGASGFIGVWGLPLCLISAGFYAFSFPSFLSLQGFPYLAYLSLIPLFIVFNHSTFRNGVFYGVVFGVVQTMLINYWLGTFNLLSLQFITIYYLIIYTIFMIVTLWLHRNTGKFNFLVFPAAWVVFDYVRTYGFMGYPWGMPGTSQYGFIPLIQIASLTGVWGISFLVVLCNSVLSEVVSAIIGDGLKEESWNMKSLWKKIPLLPPALFLLLFLLSLIFGYTKLKQESNPQPERTVKIALIQQNTDPRKHNYDLSLTKLKRLTDMALKEKPDLIVWPETAFVPNIRRWSKEDPEKYQLARLVKEFLLYQKQTGTWLLTGNDDYLLKTDEMGDQVRLDFNASVLFSHMGQRIETYHKVHLVPFTEYFPFKEELPWLYRLLLNFDINLWEPGEERTVFLHPLFSFSTPICFEDCFPGEIRDFILAGANVIINLSNDYWSLTSVEAKQHFINAVFRAVETGKPLLRATVSGLTSYVDTEGRLIESTPYYQEAYITVDVPIEKSPPTFYLRFGDWFPAAMIILLGVILELSYLLNTKVLKRIIRAVFRKKPFA